ncbi:hypothetical protein SLEP1_g41037 [Rubroshorea leprosula]|uniref:Uncharacterized protein n=1 Tax=Rubroshorea leprosula TaxID=152421 RepID=A0AAV5L676_9ROSI|nr:hypothetical protein SLEP1_g41037 [Rubroshorea leprosula]
MDGNDVISSLYMTAKLAEGLVFAPPVVKIPTLIHAFWSNLHHLQATTPPGGGYLLLRSLQIAAPLTVQIQPLLPSLPPQHHRPHCQS